MADDRFSLPRHRARYLEPLLLYGGAALYLFGWIANYV